MVGETRYYYCEFCGQYFEDDAFIHDVQCPDCCEPFLDGEVVQITEKEYEEKL